VAADVVNNKLFLLRKGVNHRRVLVYIFDSADSLCNWSAWHHWVEVGGSGTTDVALAAAAFNSSLYLFGMGINKNQLIYVNTYRPSSR
ncbi:MAG: hypothetical protein JW732_08825, partial [Dehalococcoidia bacterium]|nr:hypothetical protein [Dehalococcoidia bacterium]